MALLRGRIGDRWTHEAPSLGDAEVDAFFAALIEALKNRQIPGGRAIDGLVDVRGDAGPTYGPNEQRLLNEATALLNGLQANL